MDRTLECIGGPYAGQQATRDGDTLAFAVDRPDDDTIVVMDDEARMDAVMGIAGWYVLEQPKDAPDVWRWHETLPDMDRGATLDGF